MAHTKPYEYKHRQRVFEYDECLTIRELFHEGFSFSEIHEYIDYKGSTGTIQAVVAGKGIYAEWFDGHAGRSPKFKHNNPQYYPHPHITISDKDIDKIFELREQGLSHVKIAEQIGCGKSRVGQILLKGGR